jgi:small subunit ribosomal protein S16
MAVKLRLQRHGRGKRPFYHIVAADSRSPRDGKFIERIGDYNPLTKPATIHLDVDKALKWLQNGAGYTDTVHAILKYKGVLYKKHLLRGVAKGAFSAEVAEQKFQEWLEAHKNKVLDHQRKHHKSKEEIAAKLLAEEAKKREERERKRAEALAAQAVSQNQEETSTETTQNSETTVEP